MLPALFAGLAADLSAVERVMRDALRTDEPRVASLLEELGDFHGKMLRPALVILTARTLGEVSSEHHTLGAALEMIHTATLIHDDLIDEGDVRRGKPTAHVRFGNPTAVLLGDYFYTRAFDLVARLERPALMSRLTRVTNIVCEGELHQMCARRDLALSEVEYERIIYGKTAALTEIACVCGAVTGGPAIQEAGAAYGRWCGMAFQIVDDCLDLTGDPQKVGKTLATDIEMGRLTLPFIRLLENAPASEQAVLGERLLGVAGPEDVEAVRRLAIERGGVAAAMATAREYAHRAVDALTPLPDNEAKRQLIDLARFIVAREF
jgi:octaprenyl-diphosphate synthase